MKYHAKSDKKNIDWYFPRVNGRIVLPEPKKKSPARPSAAHLEKDNVEARHRASWRSPRLFSTIAALSFLAAGTASAAIVASKESVPASPALVSREATATTAQKPVAKKKGGLPERDPELVKLAKTSKSVQGVVTGVSAHGIAVEYGSDPKEGGMEIWLNYVQGMKYVGFQDLKELGEGDTVGVSYKQAPDHRKLVDKIELISKKPAAPEAGTVLESAEAAQ